VVALAASLRVDGTWEVNGLIGNGTNADFVDVLILIQAIDEAGNVLDEEFGTTLVAQLPSGGEIPFRMIGFEDAGPDSQFLAQADQFVEADLIQPELEIFDSTIVADADQIHILGRIVNHSDFAVTVHAIAASFFDSDLIASERAQVWVSHLDPGEDGPFRVSMPHHGRETLDYRLYIDAEFAQLASRFPIDVTSVHGYSDQTGGFQLIGELSHSHASPLYSRLVVAIYDRDGILIDTALVDPAPSLDSGARIPFAFSGWGPLNSIPELQEGIESFVIQWDPGWTFELESAAARFPVENMQIVQSEGGLTVLGSVGSETVDQLHIIAGVRDASGNLRGVNSVLMDGVAAGAQVIFEVFIPLEAGLDQSDLVPFAIAQEKLNEGP
jgi:hypothetical protein